MYSTKSLVFPTDSPESPSALPERKESPGYLPVITDSNLIMSFRQEMLYASYATRIAPASFSRACMRESSPGESFLYTGIFS